MLYYLYFFFLKKYYIWFEWGSESKLIPSRWVLFSGNSQNISISLSFLSFYRTLSYFRHATLSHLPLQDFYRCNLPCSLENFSILYASTALSEELFGDKNRIIRLAACKKLSSITHRGFFNFTSSSQGRKIGIASMGSRSRLLASSYILFCNSLSSPPFTFLRRPASGRSFNGTPNRYRRVWRPSASARSHSITMASPDIISPPRWLSRVRSDRGWHFIPQ